MGITSIWKRRIVAVTLLAATTAPRRPAATHEVRRAEGSFNKYGAEGPWDTCESDDGFGFGYGDQSEASDSERGGDLFPPDSPPEDDEELQLEAEHLQQPKARR